MKAATPSSSLGSPHFETATEFRTAPPPPWVMREEAMTSSSSLRSSLDIPKAPSSSLGPTAKTRRRPSSSLGAAVFFCAIAPARVSGH